MEAQAEMTTEQWLEQIQVDARVESRQEKVSIWPMNARAEACQIVIGVSDNERAFDPAIRVELTVIEWLQETREGDALFMASTMEPHYEGLMMRVFDQIRSLTVPTGSVFVLGDPVVVAPRLDPMAVHTLMQRALPQLALSKSGTLRRHMKQAVAMMAHSPRTGESALRPVLNTLARNSESYPKVMAG